MMIAVVLPLSALLAGVALLLAGSGLLGTLLAVRGALEGFDERTLGLVMSGYFAGFFLGTFAAPGLIRRIGHVRAFAFYIGVCVIAVLLHPLWVNPWAWFLLRLFTGAALVGLYTVIESWLNGQTEAQHRSGVARAARACARALRHAAAAVPRRPARRRARQLRPAVQRRRVAVERVL